MLSTNPDETLVLRLSSSAEVERDADESVITISDNDPIPTLSLEPDNPSVREGDSVTIRARLSNPSAEAILVALTLEGQTALLDSDYLPPVELSYGDRARGRVCRVHHQYDR